MWNLQGWCIQSTTHTPNRKLNLFNNKYECKKKQKDTMKKYTRKSTIIPFPLTPPFHIKYCRTFFYKKKKKRNWQRVMSSFGVCKYTATNTNGESEQLYQLLHMRSVVHSENTVLTFDHHVYIYRV